MRTRTAGARNMEVVWGMCPIGDMKGDCNKWVKRRFIKYLAPKRILWTGQLLSGDNLRYDKRYRVRYDMDSGET